MKKLLALAFALVAVSSVQAAAVSWSITDSSMANMNYAVVDASVITALQNGQEYTNEDLFNSAISAGTTYSEDNIGSALTRAGSLNGKGKASNVITDVGSSVSFVFWSGTPADGGSFKYGTFATSEYAYEPPNTPTKTLTLSGLSSGTFSVSTLAVPEPTTVALLALGLAALGLKRKVA